jgi:hypothetical protein
MCHAWLYRLKGKRETDEMEKTIRRNGKWAKITRKSRGVYIYALGFEGNIKAASIHEGSRALAEIAAEYWLND